MFSVIVYDVVVRIVYIQNQKLKKNINSKKYIVVYNTYRQKC